MIFLSSLCAYISEHGNTTESSACAFVTAQDFLCLHPAQPYPVYNSWQHARGGQGQTSPVCLNNNSYLNGPLCEFRVVCQQPSCALSRQFLSDKFNGCLAVGHAWTRGAVSCQEPDGSTLGLLISRTASQAALRQVKEREKGGGRESRKEGMGAGSEESGERLKLKGGQLNAGERKRRAKFRGDSGELRERWSRGRKGRIWAGLNGRWKGRFKKEMGNLRGWDEVRWTQRRKDVIENDMRFNMMGKRRGKEQDSVGGMRPAREAKGWWMRASDAKASS